MLLGYIALTDHLTAVKPIIPFKVDGKIDPFNVGQLALQTFPKPFQKDKKAKILIFDLPLFLAFWLLKPTGAETKLDQ